jgi:hypothetical protein
MKFAWTSLVVLTLFGLCLIFIPINHAQNITALTPTQFTGVGAHTSCMASAPGTSNLCLAGDGLWISVNGGTYSQVGAAVAGGITSITINGTTKTGPAPSFTLTGSTTAPAPTITTLSGPINPSTTIAAQ